MADVTLESVGTHDKAVADIVFVHGLGGDARGTWMVKERDDTYWPTWVYEDLRKTITPCSVWALDYPADATRWAGKGGAMALPDRATGVLRFLINRDIGKRPVIFIGHSLGGLLIKYLLQTGATSTEARARQLVDRTLAVVFMATPHRGSNLASLGKGLRIARATATLQDLDADNPYLNQIDMWYRDNVNQLRIRTFAVREDRKLAEKLLQVIPGPSFWVVDPTSADPNIPGRPVIPIDADHFEICKPSGRLAAVYVNVKAFLDQALDDAQAMPRESLVDRRAFLAGLADSDEKCLCVLSSFEESVTRYKTTSGVTREFRGATVSPEDTSAAVYLCSLVSWVRSFKNLEVRASGTVRDEDQVHDLLLVGSSLTNEQTKWALSQESARYRFTLPEEGEFGIECRLCEKKWLPNDGDQTIDPEYEPGKATRIDYAIVQRLKRKRQDIFVLAGLGPVGSQGAAYFLYQTWFQLYQIYGDRPFGIVLRFGTKSQRGSFNDPTVVHRTDPTDPTKCTPTARLTPLPEVANIS